MGTICRLTASTVPVSVKSSLRKNSTILTDDEIETNPLVEVIDEGICSEEAIRSFHNTLKMLDQNIRSDFVWLVFD